MYTIRLGDDIFFDPRVDGFPLAVPRLVREANRIGTLTFTIFPAHPAYGSLQLLKSRLSVFKDGDLIYQGRPAYMRKTMQGGMEYKCEEITAVMNDFQYRPRTLEVGTDSFILDIISSISSRQEDVAFVPGDIANMGTLTGETDYTGHWDAIQDYAVEEFGGYVVPKYANNSIVIHYMPEESLPESAQVIRFGENMLNIFIDNDTIDTFSGIIPLGGTIEGSQSRVTIAPVNNGLDVLYNDDAVRTYGRREIVKEWPEIATPEALYEKALEWLRGNSAKFKQTVQVSAADLHNVDLSVESFEYLHWVTVESALHNIKARYLLTREEIPLDNPAGSTLTLGGRTYVDAA